MLVKGYERPDGSIGIRNTLLIIAVDECCEGIARHIAAKTADAVVLTNAYTCMLGGNEETWHQLVAVGQHPNVFGVLVVAMGCGSIDPAALAKLIGASGKPTDFLLCQNEGGTRSSIRVGISKLQPMAEAMQQLQRVDCDISRLVIGVKCGGSDTSSAMASNPAVGRAVDRLVGAGATCIGGELFELQGCEHILRERAVSPEVGKKIDRLVSNERLRWGVDGVELETMSVGNCVGGITTIEEKSLGALLKMGTCPIQGVLRIDKNGVERPGTPGFYLSETTMLCGGAGVNFASLGVHAILWTTGAAGFNNAIVPVIRVSGNKALMNEDMDVDVSGIMDGTQGLDAAAEAIVQKVQTVADGTPTAIEHWGDSTLTLYQKDQRVEKLLCLK